MNIDKMLDESSDKSWMHEFVWPMLSHELKSLEGIDVGGIQTETELMVELKYDGHRGQAVISDGDVKFYSRGAKDKTDRVPHLVGPLSKLPSGTVLDGEFVAFKDCAIFERDSYYIEIPPRKYTASIMGSKAERALYLQHEEYQVMITFVIFDVIAWGEEDWTVRDQQARRQKLVKEVQHLDPYIKLSPLVDLDWEDEFRSLGAEGFMIKNPHERDRCGDRHWGWLKYKFEYDSDCVVTGFNPGQGKYHDTIGSIKFGQYKNGNLHDRGQCSGMTDEIRYSILSSTEDNRSDFIGKVIKVSHKGVAGKNKFGLNHPQFVEFRDDKDPWECTWDEY